MEIRDFLSYESPDPLDFTQFDVACLSGDNGAGKSALLDAMTWALFGAARGCEGGRNQERLIRDGADHAVVDFTFALGEGVHRIVRRRGRKSGEVQLLTKRDESWVNTAGDTLRDTERRIESLLRMDYRTFTASAFLLQGRADDFLRMTAEDRREVLARLLSLEVYERLEAAARDRARSAGNERDAHHRRVEDLAGAPGQASELERRVHAAAASATEAAGRGVAAADRAAELRRRVSELEAERVGLERDRRSLAADERRLVDLHSAAEAKRVELGELEDLLGRAAQIREAVAEAERLRAAEKDIQARQERAAALSRREAELTAVIEGEAETLKRTVAGARKEVQGLAAELGELEGLEGELNRLSAQLQDTDAARAALESVLRSHAALEAKRGRLDERLTVIEARSTELEEGLRILDRGEGECPVCGSVLDEAHRRRAARDIEIELRAISGERDACRAEIETAQKESRRLSEEMQRLRSAVSEHERLARRREVLGSKIERLPLVRRRLEEVAREADVAERALVTESFAVAARRELATVRHHSSGLYDPGAHARLRRRIEGLGYAEREYGRIEHATARREALKGELEDALSAAAEAAIELERRREEIEAAERGLAGLDELRGCLREMEAGADEMRSEATRLAGEEAVLRERLDLALRDARELEAARGAERSAGDGERRYRRLSESFGRRGIPDRIIDNVRPRLQEEANEILGRLTGYGMNVRFEMQRQTKSGKARDSFDVMVRHDGGDRDFAMFSGGEAFRIAFAVRLALSRILVDRAGASLQTLVVDEGFGTQDPDGVDRLIEAIHLARTQLGFEKVLVITHMEELKGLFGAQIQVTKDPGRGSVLRTVPG